MTPLLVLPGVALAFLLLGLTRVATASDDPAPPSTVLSASVSPASDEAARSDAAAPAPLTLAQAIAWALQENLDLQIQKEGARGGENDILVEEAAFDPTATFDVLASRWTAIPSLRAGWNDQGFRIGLSQRLRFGGDYGLRLFQRRTTDPITGTPFFETDLSFQIRQPLLRGFGRDVTETPRQTAQTRHAMLQSDTETQAIAVIVAVTEAYWEWVFSIEDLQIQQQKQNAAAQLLASNRAKIALGLSAPIEALVAESGVASREEGILVARAQVQDAEDRLRLLMDRPREPLRPVDRPVDRPVEIPGEAETPAGDAGINPQVPAQLIASALARQPALIRQRLEMHRLALSVSTAKNAHLPALDLTATLVPTGRGNNLGEALERAQSADAYHWEAGLMLSYPIGNRASAARVHQATSAWRVARLTQKKLAQQVTHAVREAWRRTQTDFARMATTGKARLLAERKRAAGQERFDLGLLDSRALLELQDDEAEAQAAELRARIDYNQARVRLDQAAGLLSVRHWLP